MRRALFAVLLWAALWVCLSGAAGEELVITLGGDCVLGTREEWKNGRETFDARVGEQGLDYPFSGLREIFASDDMTLINLECVLQNGNAGHNHRKQHTFRGDPSYAEMLPAAGIEQVNIANNHTMDYGSAGMKATKTALEAAGVAYSGYRELYVWEINGHKIGFGGCRETTFLEYKPTVYRDIQKLKKLGCDVIIYSCHWGKEYSATRSKTQERMARYAVNSGADIVVGTHPHVVQGVDAMQSSDGKRSAVVLYSLGNLVFGGTHELQTHDAMLARATLRFDEAGAYLGVEMELLPILTSGSAPQNDFRPIPAAGGDAERILALAQADSPKSVRGGMWFSIRPEALAKDRRK